MGFLKRAQFGRADIDIDVETAQHAAAFMPAACRDDPGDQAVESLEIVPFRERVEVVRPNNEKYRQIDLPEMLYGLDGRDGTGLGDLVIADDNARFIFKNALKPLQAQLGGRMCPAFKRIGIGGNDIQPLNRQRLQRFANDGDMPLVRGIKRTAENRYRHASP